MRALGRQQYTLTVFGHRTVLPAASEDINWMPTSELAAKLDPQGYQVLEIEREDARYYEVEMRDANGFEVEAYLDPTTGEPLPHMIGGDGKKRSADND